MRVYIEARTVDELPRIVIRLYGRRRQSPAAAMRDAKQYLLSMNIPAEWRLTVRFGWFGRIRERFSTAPTKMVASSDECNAAWRSAVANGQVFPGK